MKGGMLVNINDFSKNMDKDGLNRMLGKFSGVMSKEEMMNVKNALDSSNPNEIMKRIKSVKAEDVSRMIKENDGLKRIIDSNPELKRNLNSALGK